MSEKAGDVERQTGQPYGTPEMDGISKQLSSQMAENKRQPKSSPLGLESKFSEHVSMSPTISGRKRIKVSASDSDKLGSINDASANNDSDGDSDVEFLFTLSSDLNEPGDNKSTAELPVEDLKVDRIDLEHDIPTGDTNINPPLSYTHASSAYVQNLAEMCYTIMHDVRWRTRENNTLFRWEQGDDLSVVKELCRYYEGNVNTGCGLCRDPESHVESQMNEKAEQPDPNEARAIHLYTRLFYRKGPWFRMDDIYKKYYALQVKRGNVNQSTDVETKENDIRQDNFLHQNDSQTSQIDGLSPGPAELEKGIDLLIADLSWLIAAGYIRGFESEEECGKTVGYSLLKSDERSIVLSKLGAKAKAKVARSSSTGTVNEIWTQMQQQKSLWSHFQPKSAKNSPFLPVRKHVDEIILQQVAKLVMHSLSLNEHSGSARSLEDDMIKHLREKLRRSAEARQLDQISGITCVRLREAPLKTLKRVVRLSLCAMEGPGQMRGDGSNGWRSIETKKSLSDLPLSPPIDENWYRISYPGLMVRFGRASTSFSKAYQPIRADQVCAIHKKEEELSTIMIFHSFQSFRTWEATVDVRANVDYLIELNEMIRYSERRKERGDKISLSLPSISDTDVDFIGVTDKRARRNFVWKFLQAYGVPDQRVKEALCQIERDLDESLPMVKLCCERVLHTIGLICLNLLSLRHDSIKARELDRIIKRPWLRHLTWESCLASLLWDILPYFERNNFYRLALSSLHVLVSGKVDEKLTLEFPQDPSPLALHLISRRARGKAFDRIVIDFTHYTRSINKLEDSKTTSPKDTLPFLTEKIVSFTNAVIRDASSSSSISFGSIRTLARRLRCPLSEIVSEFTPIEARELGLRLDNDDVESSSKTGYRDWSPLTDRSVANAIISEQSNSGRCSFVGHEDGGGLYQAGSSLTVEELALECYRSGRLPEQSDDISVSGGGFHGWHDEGGRVRALFRILCSRHVLGMDWGDFSAMKFSYSSYSRYTVHLSPYQAAPFDLHVGHGSQTHNTSFYSRRQEEINAFLSRLQRLTSQEISDLVHDEVSLRLDWSVRNKLNDPQLIRDILQLRTLCCLAAGFGGLQLATIFRCMFFDYRYYSGGLPDLLLFRATYDNPSSNRTLELVELSEWIGEEFSKDHTATIAEKMASSFFLDRDDEFLGCTKTGDSAGQGIRSSRRGRDRIGNTDSIEPIRRLPSKDMLPERLLLSHDNRKITISCMLVEVKSANDRLDPRQEDWLNILDRSGYARVCKFEKSSKVTKGEETVDTKYEE